VGKKKNEKEKLHRLQAGTPNAGTAKKMADAIKKAAKGEDKK